MANSFLTTVSRENSRGKSVTQVALVFEIFQQENGVHFAVLTVNNFRRLASHYNLDILHCSVVLVATLYVIIFLLRSEAKRIFKQVV